ncbi:hypothetical protein [Janthinobacterium agaricidamnosum]|uniref:GTPase n=1 Tax=Janthinobacterium agaricidamnosum NBRC 102515 = DSM 9628 TaxID=1349767 RepID=W0VCZ0_9BURK|nr:hypothetical protein [Janthinobacterium agaricidamnosum]CDG85243.1 putative uncharacterized protein [Janthinobacterium agaricidamnosum NBRC 102515 = DSM 9628]
MTAGITAPLATTLVVGGRASQRETAIGAALLSGVASAAILEGLSDGNSTLADLPPGVAPQILRIAPGCLCCAGNLVLRVTLNRLLRHPPEQLFISLANATHLEQLRAWLLAPPYDAYLRLEPDLAVQA